MNYILNLLLSLININFNEDILATNLDAWWGPNELKVINDNSIRPFQVTFDDEMIEDLKYRLNNHRPWSPPLEGVGFDYGFNTDVLDTWLKFWSEDYNFKERENYLNKYPQYKTRIQGLDIHFLWVKPKNCSPNTEVLPLLLLHGWPGSVREFYDAIELLTSCNRNFAIQVIVPSLPGFGFSDAPVRPGLGVKEMAVVVRNLMQRLGFKKFYIQGGDWGALTASVVANLFPDEVLGFHSNLAFSSTPKSMALYTICSLAPSLIVDDSLADRLYPISSVFNFWMREAGYLHLQATKPDTVGIGLSDSPAGLLAFHFQVISSGTRKNNYLTKDGGLNLYTKDEMLDNLMMYWASNSVTTSARLYAEFVNSRKENHEIVRVATPVPTCVLQAKDEIIYQPPVLLKYRFTNLLQTTVLEGGGHFIALEKPEVFADDVLNCIEGVRKWRTDLNKEDL